MNVIQVKDLTKHYSLGTQTVEALRGVSFGIEQGEFIACLLYTSPSPRDQRGSRMPSSA